MVQRVMLKGLAAALWAALLACSQEATVSSVSIRPEVLELMIGETELLEAEVSGNNSPSQTVLWDSSNKRIATVDSQGEVRAVGVGEATITAISTANTSKFARASVSVEAGIEGIRLGQTQVSLYLGQAFLLGVTLEGDNAEQGEVLWESSDEGVVSVDNRGVLQAVGLGEAVVRATSALEPSLTAEASVTVSPAISSIRLGAERETMLPGERQRLELSVTGAEDVDKSVAWRSSDETVLSLDDDGVARARAPGETTVRATSNHDPDVFAELRLQVSSGEPNDSRDEATELPIANEGLLLELSPGDMDWYSLDLAKPVVLSAQIDAVVIGSAADTVLGLFDEAGSLLLLNDDVSDLDPAIKRALLPGRYYVVVTGASDYGFTGDHRQSGSYRLRLSTSDPPDLSFRPERLRAEVEPGETVQARLSLSNTGESSLSYSLSDGPAGFEPANVGKLLASKDWQQLVGKASGRKHQLKQRGLLALEPVLSDPLGDTLAVGPDLQGVSAELSEDSLTLQLELAAGDFDSARFSSVIELDLDQSSLTGAEPLGFCDGLIIGPDRYLTRAPGSDHMVLRDQNLDPLGDYPLVITGDSMLAVTLPLAALDDEGNFDFSVAIGTPDEVSDCAPNSGKATVGDTDESLDPVRLEPASGRLAPGERVDIDVRIDGTDLPAGSLLGWQILLTSDSQVTPERRIDLDIEVVANRDQNEPNDSVTEAKALLPDRRTDILSIAQNDVDWFFFELSERALVTADLDAQTLEPPSGLDSVMALLSADQTVMDLDDASEDAYLEHLLEPGRYYLVVTGYPDTGFIGNHEESGPYTLLLSVSPPPQGAVSGQIFTPYEPVSLAALGIAETARFVPGQALVKFRSAGLRPQSVLEPLGLRREEHLGDGVMLVSGRVHQSADVTTATLELIQRLRAHPEVIYAEPNYLRQAFKVPSDTSYSQQWHYDAIHLEEAWEISTGSSEVTVAVLDTGLASAHPDLNCGRTRPGYDFVDNDSDPEDEGPFEVTAYHGTHVQGTVGACSDNGVGVAAVTWQTGLSAVRVLGTLGGTDADIARGIRWAAGLELPDVPANPSPAFVINMSLGGPGYSQTLQDAVNDAVEAGSVIVAAAGNSSDDAGSYAPAGLENVITVAASNPTGTLSWYSNYGDSVEILAPGGALEGFPAEDVLSTIRNEDGSYDYAFYAGTSMAAPHVSGVLALMKAVKPDLNAVYAQAYLLAGATPVGGDCPALGCGAGLIHAEAAVKAAASNAPIGAFLSSSDRLDFGAEATVLRFQLANLGDAAADISLTSETLALEPLPSRLTLAAGEVATLSLQLERSSFDEGGYQTGLKINYGESLLELPVFFRVGRGKTDIGALQVELYRRLDTGYRRYNELSSNFEDGYRYHFEGLVAGSYALYAVDATGAVAGEQVFELREDERIDDLDLTLERNASVARPPQGRP